MSSEPGNDPSGDPPTETAATAVNDQAIIAATDTTDPDDDAEARRKATRPLRLLGWAVVAAALAALLAAMLGIWVAERPTLVPAEQAAAVVRFSAAALAWQ